MQNNTSNKLQESLDCNLAMVQRGESLMASSIIAIRNIFKECVKTIAIVFKALWCCWEGSQNNEALRLIAIRHFQRKMGVSRKPASGANFLSLLVLAKFPKSEDVFFLLPEQNKFCDSYAKESLFPQKKETSFWKALEEEKTEFHFLTGILSQF